MATWPDIDDLATWMAEENLGDAGTDAEALQMALDSATDLIRGRLDPDLLPEDVGVCPDGVRLGIMMRALSLYMRRMSPTGVVAFSPENVFRVNRMDADVDQQIARYLWIPVG